MESPTVISAWLLIDAQPGALLALTATWRAFNSAPGIRHRIDTAHEVAVLPTRAK